MFKMACLCYYNNWSFAVGNKYLTIENVLTNEVKRMELTPQIISMLTTIKDNTFAVDASRTYQVLRLFDRKEQEGTL